MKVTQRTIWVFFSFLALSSTALAQGTEPLPLPAQVLNAEADLPPLPDVPDATSQTRAPAPAVGELPELPDVTPELNAPTPALSELPQVPDVASELTTAPMAPSAPAADADAPPAPPMPGAPVPPAVPQNGDALPIPPAEIAEESIVPAMEDAPMPFSPSRAEDVEVFDLFSDETDMAEPPVRAVQRTPEPVTVRTPVVVEKKPSSNVDLNPVTGTHYRLPKGIYKKQYTRDNRHLPTARYEVEYDAQLFVAVANDHVEAVRGLLERGRNVNMQNAAGESLVAYAVRHRSTNSLRLLLGRGSNPDEGDVRGLTPLFYSMVADRPDYTQILLSMGADPNQPNGEGLTPLMYAATKSDASYLRLLLAAGAEPNLTTFDGRSPLHVAAEYNNVAAAQALVEAGAFINAQKLRGTTPLMSAAAAGSSQVTSFLLAVGADTGLTDHLGRDAVQLAKAFRQPVLANQVMTAATRRELASVSYRAQPVEEVGEGDVVPLAPQTQ